MPFAHSFTGVTPPARYDSVAWSHVRIEESATSGGTYTQIDEQSIAADASPDTPNPVNVTTVLGTLASAYYRFRFRDASSVLSGYSDPVLSPGGSDDVCSIAQIDAILSRGGTSSEYTDAQKVAARSVAQDAFELEAGVAFTPRSRTLTVDGSGTTDLILPVPRVLTCTAATVDDDALTIADVKVLEHAGGLYYESGWTCGRLNVVVTITHGWSAAPADVSRAVALLASSILADGPWDDRGYGVTEGGGLVRLLTAGVSRAAFSIPDVQAALNRHRYATVA